MPDEITGPRTLLERITEQRTVVDQILARYSAAENLRGTEEVE
jgi:hypothetical protein